MYRTTHRATAAAAAHAHRFASVTTSVSLCHTTVIRMHMHAVMRSPHTACGTHSWQHGGTHSVGAAVRHITQHTQSPHNTHTTHTHTHSHGRLHSVMLSSIATWLIRFMSSGGQSRAALRDACTVSTTLCCFYVLASLSLSLSLSHVHTHNHTHLHTNTHTPNTIHDPLSSHVSPSPPPPRRMSHMCHTHTRTTEVCRHVHHHRGERWYEHDMT